MGREIKVKAALKWPQIDLKGDLKDDLKNDLAVMVISTHLFKVIFGMPSAPKHDLERVPRNHHSGKVILKVILKVVFQVILRPSQGKFDLDLTAHNAPPT